MFGWKAGRKTQAVQVEVGQEGRDRLFGWKTGRKRRSRLFG